ncbi:MAG: PorV/PorQ family protein [bacterium]
MRVSIIAILSMTSVFSFQVAVAGDLVTAKYAGEFLALGAGGRSLGMGSAFVAVARDVTSGYWNPAGLAYVNYPQFMLMHSRQFRGEVNYDFGAVALPVGHKSSLGLSIIRLGVDDIQQTALRNPDVALGETYVDENGQLVRNTPFVKDLFGSTDLALFLTYSKKVADTFSYGGNVKFINRSIGDHSAWGLGFDVGFIFNPASNVFIGLNLQDITTTLLAWDTGRRELLRPSFRAGVTYPIFLSSLGGRIQPAVDFVFRFENRQESALASIGASSVDINYGWEYVYHDAFAVRFGFAGLGDADTGQMNLGQFTAGVGLHFPKLQIDYAYLGHEELGNTHRISARLTLEEPRFRRKK